MLHREHPLDNFILPFVGSIASLVRWFVCVMSPDNLLIVVWLHDLLAWVFFHLLCSFVCWLHDRSLVIDPFAPLPYLVFPIVGFMTSLVGCFSVCWFHDFCSLIVWFVGSLLSLIYLFVGSLTWSAGLFVSSFGSLHISFVDSLDSVFCLMVPYFSCSLFRLLVP